MKCTWAFFSSQENTHNDQKEKKPVTEMKFKKNMKPTRMVFSTLLYFFRAQLALHCRVSTTENMGTYCQLEHIVVRSLNIILMLASKIERQILGVLVYSEHSNPW